MSSVSSIDSAPSAAEKRYLERGRAAFSVRFPGQDYGALTWDIRHLKKSGAGQGNVSLLFTRIDKLHRKEALPDRFANMVKAYFAVSGKEPGTLYNGSTAARWAWEAIRERLGGNGEAFSWAGFSKEDAERAEELMLLSGMQPSSAYRRCVDLHGLLTGLSAAGVIAPMEPIFQTPRNDSLDRMTLDGRAARDHLLPTEEAIRCLADVYSGRYPLHPFEQLLSCIPALMFASGLRVIETLQFTTNPIRREGKRSFIYYFKAKGRGVVEEKIPLTESQSALAEQAVHRALEMTRAARQRATELVLSPTEFPLPARATAKTWLTEDEVSGLLGSATVTHLSASVETTRGTKGELLFGVTSLRGYLQGVRDRTSLESIRGVTPRCDGTWLPLDQALFICFQNEGHKARGTNPLMVSLISQQQVGAFLGGAGNGLKSVFERLGMTERNGQFVQLNSHQIRHYVTSKASGAGISDAHLVRWQRRAHEGDLEAYKHLTSEERVGRLRSHIKSGRLKGEIATMYFALATAERDVFLENVVQAVHVTHLGFCVHDFNTSPCPSAMNCVKRCGSYLFDTADEDQRQRLRELQGRNLEALEQALSAEAAGNGLMASEWVRELRETDEGLRIVLAAEPGAGSTFAAPFAGSPSKFQTLE